MTQDCGEFSRDLGCESVGLQGLKLARQDVTRVYSRTRNLRSGLNSYTTLVDPTVEATRVDNSLAPNVRTRRSPSNALSYMPS